MGPLGSLKALRVVAAGDVSLRTLKKVVPTPAQRRAQTSVRAGGDPELCRDAGLRRGNATDTCPSLTGAGCAFRVKEAAAKPSV